MLLLNPIPADGKEESSGARLMNNPPQERALKFVFRNSSTTQIQRPAF